MDALFPDIRVRHDESRRRRRRACLATTDTVVYLSLTRAGYMFSGVFGDIFQYVVYSALIHYTMDRGGNEDSHRPTICFAIAYLTAVAVRQQTHRLLVFGHFEGSCLQNLANVYASYFLVIVLSILVNRVFIYFVSALYSALDIGRIAPVDSHTAAYVMTSIVSGVIAYHLLKSRWTDAKTNKYEKVVRSDASDDDPSQMESGSVELQPIERRGASVDKDA